MTSATLDKPVRILNVDDRDISRYVHETTLRRDGFVVVSVASGTEALAAARDDIDVVILDVQLPDMDGFDVCRRLKSDPATCNVIVLMTSAAFVTARDRTMGLDCGADGYLAQPYEMPELKATLRSLLRARTAEHRAQALSAELQRAMGVRDEFLAMLAHELRNPIASISMALTMLERVEGDVAQARPHHETARRQVGHLVRMVDDLLDVSRVTRGSVELRMGEVDLAAVVQSAVTAAQPAIEARGHELLVAVAPDSFRLIADATRLEQVLINLLTNAARYTDVGGSISVRLTRELVAGEAQAVMRVRDTGRGIPHDMLEKVFDVFVQVAPSIDRTIGGLGIGLTLVKRMVEMHGGSVSAHCEGPGTGTEFVVRLPLPHLEFTAPAIVAPARSSQPPADGADKRRILLVEDTADVADPLIAFLERLGHDVVLAKDGLEGAKLVLQLRPDVALVDIGLPGIDGYELARRVRAQPGGDTLFLVALSGYGGVDAKAKAEGAGFDMHLTKPVDIQELRQVVNRSRPVVQSPLPMSLPPAPSPPPPPERDCR